MQRNPIPTLTLTAEQEPKLRGSALHLSSTVTRCGSKSHPKHLLDIVFRGFWVIVWLKLGENQMVIVCC